MCLRGPSAGVNDETLASLTLMFLMSMQHLNLAPCRAPFVLLPFWCCLGGLQPMLVGVDCHDGKGSMLLPGMTSHWIFLSL